MITFGLHQAVEHGAQEDHGPEVRMAAVMAKRKVTNKINWSQQTKENDKRNKG